MTPSLDTALLPALALSAGAGLLSFLSPCVLPLVPAWLSYVSGYGLADIREGRGRGRMVARSLAFSLGFTVVFVLLGLAFAGGAQAIGAGAGARRALRIVSGAVIALLGANLALDFAKFLNYEKRFHPSRPRAGGLKGLGGAFLLGLAFAAGWSPCIGPILASILLLASDVASSGLGGGTIGTIGATGTAGTAGAAGAAGLARAGALLFAYSAGLALPFLATGLAFDRLSPLLEKAKRKGGAIRVVAGLLLVALGLLMATGRLGSVSGIASRTGYAILDSLENSPATPLAVDLGIEGALVAAIVISWATRRTRGNRPAKPPIVRIVVVALLLLAAAGEAAGFWSLARIVAGWLTFQGG